MTPAVTTQRDVGYLSPALSAAYLGISRTVFFKLARDYRRSAGRIGIGPAFYFSARSVVYARADLDKCAKRYQRGVQA
jgi:hypothetical protein